jgi:hypothetical protein
MIGRRYLLRGEPVTVLARWAPPADMGSVSCPKCGRIFECLKGCVGVWCCSPERLKPRRQGPRNVLIRHEFMPGDRLTVRPFRGLRREFAAVQEDEGDA